MASISTYNKTLEMIETLKFNDELTVIDIETSGLSPNKGGRIIEIGAVKTRNGNIIDTFSQLINPEQKIYSTTIDITGITNEMLDGMPVYRQVLPLLYKFIGGGVVAAHNSAFDWDRFLIHYFQKVGMFPQNKVICSLQLSKYFYPLKEKHNLEEMCRELSIPLVQHRALNDAIATAQIIHIYKERAMNQENIFHAQQIDLIGDTQYTKEETSIDTNIMPNTKNFNIKRIKFWSPDENTNKKDKKRRLYVTLNIGTAYFDIPTKSWGNKDIHENINFEILQDSVIKFLKLRSVEDLCSYRN